MFAWCIGFFAHMCCRCSPDVNVGGGGGGNYFVWLESLYDFFDGLLQRPMLPTLPISHQTPTRPSLQVQIQVP